MSLLVQKFGGSSVGTIERIKHVAHLIKHSLESNHRIVVVVSAMGDETDRLCDLMQQISATPNDREYSALLASGEQMSSALLSLALNEIGVKSKSYNAYQIQLLTSLQHRKSPIQSINSQRLLEDLDQGIVPVVAGFQGINEEGDLTTLGRGGSDTTAVALAAFLQAQECQIFTDVDGVYTADPRMVQQAQLIHDMDYNEMLAFAELGAQVLQTYSVEMARKYNVSLRVLSSLTPARGTLVTSSCSASRLVCGIACVDDQVKVTLRDVAQTDRTQILDHMQRELIEYDMLAQNEHVSHHDMSFVIHEGELPPLCRLTHDFHIQTGMAKISLVGQGMQRHAGFAATILQLMSKQDIHIHSIFSTEIKVSILIDSVALQHAVKMLHEEFIVNSQLSVKV